MNNFFCYFYTKFAAAWGAILIALGFKQEVLKEVFQEGTMVVVGTSCVELQLDTLPLDVLVELSDEALSASCDPHQDMVYYKVVSDCNCKYSLKIKWDVSTVREVYWRVTY